MYHELWIGGYEPFFVFPVRMNRDLLSGEISLAQGSAEIKSLSFTGITSLTFQLEHITTGSISEQSLKYSVYHILFHVRGLND